MARLRSASEAEARALAELDQTIKKRLMETREVRFQEAHNGTQASAATAGGRKLEGLVDSLEELQRRRDERSARKQVFDQLLFQVDSKWSAPPFREFLEQQLIEMSITEASDQSGRPKLWRFYSYLSVALREVAEPRENVIEFIAGYMNFSSVLRPRPPSEYVAERSYSNGAQSMAARPMTPEKAGDETDRRLRELGILPKPAARKRLAPADMAIRYRPLPAPQGPPPGAPAGEATEADEAPQRANSSK